MTTIRAAGGVVWRLRDADIEVCLVHRPRYDDWSLPKGKLEPGEHPLIAAVREVAEEADVRAVPQVRLPPVRYVTRDGVGKAVDYWSMQAVDKGGFQLHTEVDAIRWLPVDAAARLATYTHDVGVLRDFAALPPVTAVLALVRSGDVERIGSGPDAGPPLTAAGLAQARALAPLLAVIGPQRLLSGAVRGCAQSLRPLAELLDLPVEVDSAFDGLAPGPDEVGAPHGPGVAVAVRLASLATAGTQAVVCGPGRVIPDALARLAAGSPDGFPTGPGTGWLLAFNGDRLLAADALVPTRG